MNANGNMIVFFFSSRRRHTRWPRDWSSDVCSSDLSRGGKLKTILQVIAIGLYVLPGPFGVARVVAMAAAVIVTLITGADYVARAMRLRRQSFNPAPAAGGGVEPGNRGEPDGGVEPGNRAETEDVGESGDAKSRGGGKPGTRQGGG